MSESATTFVASTRALCEESPPSYPPVGARQRPDGVGSCPVGAMNRPVGVIHRPDGVGSCPDGVGSCPVGVNHQPFTLRFSIPSTVDHSVQSCHWEWCYWLLGAAKVNRDIFFACLFGSIDLSTLQVWILFDGFFTVDSWALLSVVLIMGILSSMAMG